VRTIVNTKIQAIQPSGIRKFFDIAAEMDNVISLGVGEPDFDTPWNVREAAIYSLEQGRTVYTANAGLKELRQAIARYTQQKYQLDYDPLTQILVTVGGSEAIDIALRVMLDEGDEVLLPEPSFVAYKPCAIMAGGKVTTIALQAKHNFKLTREELEAAWTPKSKVLIFAYPNNPTGAVMTAEDMEEVCRFIIEKDMFVISDEIYSELTYSDTPHRSIASMPGMKERTLVINGFSKAFSMTGWRLGYAEGPKTLIQQMTKMHQFAIMCAPTTSQYAAVEALAHCEDDVALMRREYNRRRRYVVDRFHKMGLACPEPEGAFYVFPSIRECGMSSEEFCQKLLQEQRVAVVPGSAFGESGEGFVRVSYAYSMQELKVALDRIELFVRQHGNKA
jgi:aminotransferase